MARKKKISIRVSETEDNDLRGEWKKTNIDSFSNFLRHILFNFGLPSYKKYKMEKDDWQRIRKFIFKD